MADKQAPAAGARRFFKLAGMTTSVASRYAGQAIKGAFQDQQSREQAKASMHLRNGRKVAQTLGELKGAVMKMGQAASQIADLLPEEFADTLQALQRNAPPMAYEVIAAQVEAELGQPPEALFKEFCQESHAAASIGQVHRATMHDGRQVIVKVQYPGVADSCDSDLAQLKRTLRIGRLINVDKPVLDAVFEEIRERLHEELDYRQEAENLKLFQAHFQGTEGLVFPQLVEELCSERLLTLSFEPGDHVEQVQAPAYSQDTINVLGERLFHFLCRQVFELGAVHADPHAGNFAYRSDGSLVVYDFGCVKRLLPNVLEDYRQTVVAGLQADYPALDKGLLRLGVRKADGPVLSDEFYSRWRDIVMQPFMGSEAFDFAASTMHKDVAKYTPQLMRHLDSLQPPVETAYLDRMVGGHYWNMVQLGAKGVYGPPLREYLGMPAG